MIPTNYQKHFAIERQQLLQSLQRAAILSNEKFRGVRWMLSANSLRISCTNNEQEEAQEELEITYRGDALDIGFNITYLLDVLNNVHSEQVDCAFGDANSSMLITRAGATAISATSSCRCASRSDPGNGRQAERARPAAAARPTTTMRAASRS